VSDSRRVLSAICLYTWAIRAFKVGGVLPSNAFNLLKDSSTNTHQIPHPTTITTHTPNTTPYHHHITTHTPNTTPYQ
jgi:hypothetical protein